ncbi:ABC-F family ATP-binding cassette domain-containing protein [Vreelandella zhanjiangensis]|uniref:ABC-F family ATP-binding cassette domain-containing protein n=1 Tax=Vreelandella zhanjiangensis TaxID=1121960 RepID=UPI00037141DA|nr:ABC-F family ATP-binding cassette domain-containing protein [Halomonas zhanjiangensis]
MTKTFISLERVSYTLPHGRLLFSELTETFDTTPTGLIGRNGMGKTLLARLMAGEIAPSTGRCMCTGEVRYLSQRVTQEASGTLADLAGVGTTLAALAHIEAGSPHPDDFDALGDRWDIRQTLQRELEHSGLAHLDATTPATTLSGGEAMRVALIGVLLSRADFLILDEPSNHLDGPSREALIEQLTRWPKGLLVVSHDRQLLAHLPRIVELSPLGLRSYGGNYSFYAEQKASEQAAAQTNLEHHQKDKKRAERALSQQQERQERRQARGNRQRRDANQAKILLDRQKERSELSAGRLARQQAETHSQHLSAIQQAREQLAEDTNIALHDIAVQPAKRMIAELTDITLSYVAGKLNLSLQGQQRLGIVGPNGSGKSTLLKLLAGQLLPQTGESRIHVKSAYLDQHLAQLNKTQSAIEQLKAANRAAPVSLLRTRLVHLGLTAEKISVACAKLSGGEQLKVALACALYADPPAQLLLLDEPSNHLDLPSLQALESMLRGYPGALVVVSHDQDFLHHLALTDYLRATSDGWVLEPATNR